MQPTHLKEETGKLTRMGGDRSKIIVFPSLFHRTGLVGGKEDI